MIGNDNKSQREKAKAYDEAIERVKKNLMVTELPNKSSLNSKMVMMRR